MSNYIAINIGRNVGNEPMSDVAWFTFQGDALDLVTRQGRAGNAVIASGVATGRNTWEGVEEDTATAWAVYASHALNTYDIGADAAKLARAYEQDGVAVVTGDSTLHGPNV